MTTTDARKRLEERAKAQASAEHGELREAIAAKMFSTLPLVTHPTTWEAQSEVTRDVWRGHADALIAGPLAGLLAELERHRAGREVEQQMIRNAVVQLADLHAQVNEANRKLDAVRELADDWVREAEPAGFSLSAILDATDGGDRDE